jgi:hypothetical protein
MSANTCAEKLLHVASSLANRGILHLPRVSFLFFLDKIEDGILFVCD